MEDPLLYNNKFYIPRTGDIFCILKNSYLKTFLSCSKSTGIKIQSLLCSVFLSSVLLRRLSAMTTPATPPASEREMYSLWVELLCFRLTWKTKVVIIIKSLPILIPSTLIHALNYQKITRVSPVQLLYFFLIINYVTEKDNIAASQVKLQFPQ